MCYILYRSNIGMYMSTMMADLLDYMKISVEEIYNEDEYDANTKFSDGAEYWIEVKDVYNPESS